MSDLRNERWIQERYDRFDDLIESKDYHEALKVVKEVQDTGFIAHSERLLREYNQHLRTNN